MLIEALHNSKNLEMTQMYHNWKSKYIPLYSKWNATQHLKLTNSGQISKMKFWKKQKILAKNVLQDNSMYYL